MQPSIQIDILWHMTTRSLSDLSAKTYAEWFACLAEPTRVRMLHAVATTPAGLTVGELTELLGISQSTCSHHVRKLADTGFVLLHKEGTTTRVTVNYACCAGLPHAADAVMGLLDDTSPCCSTDVPDDVAIRALEDDDWPAVRRIYGDGIATGIATFETAVPTRDVLEATWLPGHRWVAEIGGTVIGWTAARRVSSLDHAAGIGETATYVAEPHQHRGIGTALIHTQVTAADDAGLWTLQASILTENRPAIALYHAAGFRTVGVRERIAQRDGIWHDTLLLERRAGA
jgi:L-amino acid N-acyltransferase YncA/DNA-binding transcriptional ArsR family regulator